jgi:CHASE2 domain-containing sensor protein
MPAYLAVLKLGEGNFESGFPVTLQIGRDNLLPSLEVTGKLPSAPEIPQYYDRWQRSYLRLGLTSRLEAKAGFVSNVSRIEDCDRAARDLRDRFHQWLECESFRPIREKLLEQLKPSDEVRILLQTEDWQIKRLPWHLWDWFDRYPKAEMALCSPVYEKIEQKAIEVKEKVRILAIVGDSTNINTHLDRQFLSQLPDAEVSLLIEPNLQTLTENLWSPLGWDILFFAGHSSSKNDRGCIYLNQTDSLTITELKSALKKAIERGLQIAIFNSCDGLGLAKELTDLQIPQVLVMREPVPDRVAQEFLKYFLEAFARGQSFYLAVREAREKLQGLENKFLCATWLPAICQNLGKSPLSWGDLLGKYNQTIRSNLKSSPLPTNLFNCNFRQVLLAGFAIASLVVGIRHGGIIQPLELKTFDRTLEFKPQEKPDPRLVVVTVSEEDIKNYNSKKNYTSLPDPILEKLLQKLESLQPRVIGLDIYRDFPVDSNRKDLARRLQQYENFIAVCKISDRTIAEPGIAASPEVASENTGFSDFVVDPDGRVRRQLLAVTPELASPCQASYAFSTQLAFRYLAAEGIFPNWSAKGDLQLGRVLFQHLEANTGVYPGVDTWGHQILLNYRSHNLVAERVSLTDILEGKIKSEYIRDRIVLIGKTDYSFGDYWLTPHSQNKSYQQQVSGVMMQAQMTSQILSTVLDGRPLFWVLPSWAEALWILSWSFLGGLLVWRLKLSSERKDAIVKFLITILSVQIGLYGLCCLLLVQIGCWLPLVPAILASLGTSSSIIIYEFTKRSEQRERVYEIIATNQFASSNFD